MGHTTTSASGPGGSPTRPMHPSPNFVPASTGVRSLRDAKRQSVMDAVAPLMPGDILDDRYCIDGLIAQGGMSVVYEAHHLQLQHRLAIKVLEGADPQSHNAVLAEAHVAATLDSEHTVRVLDVGTLPTGEPFLVMERLSGMDLSQYLRENGMLPIPQALTIAMQVCQALAEAHLLGIVHRDIKPSNVFLCCRSDRSSVVKVLDFGVACAQRAWDCSHPGDAGLVGSPGYAAPEQLEAGALVDQRADVFGLGALLYELLTGRRAFNLTSLAEAMLVVSRDDPAPMPATIPRELQGIVLRCMARHREQRYQSVVDVANALAVYAPFLEPAARSVEEVTDRTRKWQPSDSGEVSNALPALERTVRISRSDSHPSRVPSKTPRKPVGDPLLVAQILPTSNWLRRLSVTLAAGATVVVCGGAVHSLLQQKQAPAALASPTPQVSTSAIVSAIPLSPRTASVSILQADSPGASTDNSARSPQPSASTGKHPGP